MLHSQQTYRMFDLFYLCNIFEPTTAATIGRLFFQWNHENEKCDVKAEY